MGMVRIVLPGRLGDPEIAWECERLRGLLASGETVCYDAGGLTTPDGGTLEALARLQLTARRHGTLISLCNAPGPLVDLLFVAGLLEVLPLQPGDGLPGFEPRGEAEEREQRLRADRRPAEHGLDELDGVGLEEEAQPGDPAR